MQKIGTRRKQRKMVTKVQRSNLRLRKLHPLRARAGSKSVKKSSILLLDALLYIRKLKLKLQELQREYLILRLMKHIQIPKEVKVEKSGEGFLVKVICKKEGHMLVSILEAFGEMGLTVVQARVSCNNFFAMEAIAVAQNQQAIDVKDVTQAVLKALEREGG